MPLTTSDPSLYSKQLLDIYLHTPGTLGHLRREDRRLALLLYDRSVPLRTVEDALLLATARRSFRSCEAPPLYPIRSLHYFLPVIEELLLTPLPLGYADYLQHKLKLIQEAHNKKTPSPRV
jgi:hypothetical protein